MPSHNPTIEEFNALVTRVTNLESFIVTLDTRINDLEIASDNHENRITALENNNPPPPPPSQPVCELTANPSSIEVGQSVILTWTSQNGVLATLNGVSVELNGTQSFAPTTNTTYTLVVNGQSGTVPAESSVSVTVTEPPPPPSFEWPGIDEDLEITDSVTLTGLGEARRLTVTGELILQSPCTLRVRDLVGTGTVRCIAPNHSDSVQIIIADLPFDAADTDQLGNGIVFEGKFHIEGAAKVPFARLAVEPKIGHTTLHFSEAIDGWQVGDKLWLPDTRHLIDGQRWTSYVPQWETVTIQSIESNNSVIITSPVQFNHEGARNPEDVLEALPHAANMSRNVVIRSENMNGNRGHVMFTNRADVDIRYCKFGGLGRTTNLSTSVKGRYPVHFHHLSGPVVPQSNGHQFTFIGNAVTCPLNPMPFIWGVTIHRASYGLIKDNVVTNWNGAGIVTEEGTEHFNVIEHNFVSGIIGLTSPRANDGMYGTGFWFKGFNNYVRNNVAASCIGRSQGIVAGTGFDFTWIAASTQNTKKPKFQGANIETDYVLINQGLIPILEFSENEAYGAMSEALTIWHVGTDGYSSRNVAQSVIKNLKTWHAYECGFFGYNIENVLFDGFWDRGHKSALHPNNASGFWSSGDYWAGNITIRNADSRGRYVGIYGSLNTPPLFRVENSIFQCWTANIQKSTMATPGSGAFKPPRTTEIHNCKFLPWAGQAQFIAIETKYDLSRGKTDVVQLDKILVTDFNNVVGDNFRLYYTEQRPDFIVPQSNTTSGLIGCPEANLTNEQAYKKYHSDRTLKNPEGSLSDPEGMAVAGAVAPTNAPTRPGVIGFVVTF